MFAGGFAGDVGTQSVLIAGGLQEEVSWGQATMSGFVALGAGMAARGFRSGSPLPNAPSRGPRVNLLDPINPKFGDNDLVYGIYQARMRYRGIEIPVEPAARMKARSRGKLLTDLDPPPGMKWDEFTTVAMERARQGGNKIRFNLTHIENMDDLLAGRGPYANKITSKELRYLRDNWDRFEGSVVFYRNNRVVPAPW
jgi:hypothetical protein